MGTVVGADVNRLKQLVSALTESAASLGSLSATVDSGVSQLAHLWVGSDAADFHHRWTQGHRPALTRALSALESAARTVQSNAAAQEAASEADPAASPGWAGWAVATGTSGVALFAAQTPQRGPGSTGSNLDDILGEAPNGPRIPSAETGFPGWLTCQLFSCDPGMDSYRDLTGYWADELDVSERALAATIAHEGGYIRRMGPYNRNDHLIQWQLWNSGLYPPEQGEPSIGIGQLRPAEVGVPLVKELWGIDMEADEVAERLVHDDRFAVALTAAYLSQLSDELEADGVLTDQNLFVAYAAGPAQRESMAEKNYDYDQLTGPAGETLRARSEAWYDAIQLLDGEPQTVQPPPPSPGTTVPDPTEQAPPQVPSPTTSVPSDGPPAGTTPPASTSSQPQLAPTTTRPPS